MVTVIRPYRARCANETIPRHERAVSTLKEGRMLVASTSVGGFGFSGKAQNEQMLSSLARSGPLIWALMTAIGRRGTRSVSRRGHLRVALFLPVIAISFCPIPPRLRASLLGAAGH